MKGKLYLIIVCGSGSTCIACLNANRNFIGYELNTEYFEKTKTRIENHLKTPFDDFFT